VPLAIVAKEARPAKPRLKARLICLQSDYC